MKKETKPKTNYRRRRPSNMIEKENKTINKNKNFVNPNLKDITNDTSVYAIRFDVFGKAHINEKIFLSQFGLIANNKAAEKRISKYYSKDLRKLIINKYIKSQFFKRIRAIKKDWFNDKKDEMVTIRVSDLGIRVKLCIVYSNILNKQMYYIAINKIDIFTLIKYIHTLTIQISNNENSYYKYLNCGLKGFIYETTGEQTLNNVSIGYFINSKNDNKDIARTFALSNHLSAISRIKKTFERTKVLEFKISE